MTSQHRRSNARTRKGANGIAAAFLAFTSLFLGVSHTAFAGDWPGFLGRDRDCVAQEEKPLPAWKTDLLPVGKIPLGAGYAGAVVAAGKIYIPHREDDSDYLDCYAANDQKRLWRATFPASYSRGIDPDKGPRATPTVDQGQVFFYSATADLHCVNEKDGKVIWSRALATDFKLKDSYFGVGTSPLVTDKLVVISLGGANGAAVVALDRTSGKTVWKAADDDVSYSSPILTTYQGAPLIFATLREKCVGLAPADGKVIFTTKFGGRGPSVTAATPVVEKSKLFLTAEYAIGATMLDLGKEGAPTLWKNNESLNCHYATPVLYQGRLYGVRGREDFREGDLRCVDAATGAVIWEEKDLGVAHAIRIGEQILLVGIEGQLRLIKASPKRYELLAESPLGSGHHRAAPAFSEGRLYTRASLSPTSSELRIFELSKAK